MKIISWNVNGIRSILQKGNLHSLIKKYTPDILTLSEIKIARNMLSTIQNDLCFKDYHQHWNTAEKPGYSGTAMLTKQKPISISYGLLPLLDDNEGRVITAHFSSFTLINVYTANSGQYLKRLGYRINVWDKCFRSHISGLDKSKPLIVCGDLNVAHYPIDIHNPSLHVRHAGYTIEERKSFDKLLSIGLIDSYRCLYPSSIKYSFWNYSNYARERNNGWRLDYALLSDRSILHDSLILDDYYGSDHCPIMVAIK